MDTTTQLTQTLTYLYEKQIPLYICSNHQAEKAPAIPHCAVINSINHMTQTIELLEFINTETNRSFLNGQSVKLWTLPQIGSSIQLSANIIADAELGSERIVYATLNPHIQYLDHRHEVRVIPERPSQFRVELLAEWQRRFYALLKNISLHGMECCIHSDVSEDIQIGDIISIQVETDSINEILQCQFQVLWSAFDISNQTTHIGGIFKSRNRKMLFTTGKLIEAIEFNPPQEKCL